MSQFFSGLDLCGGYLVAFGFSPGPPEMLIILVIALLLYGGRLPEMARTWGKTLAELRRSLSGIQNEINDAMYSAKDQLAIDQKEWHPENDPYTDDTVNEFSGYDEESQDDSAEDDNTTVDETTADETTDSSSAVETSTTETSTTETSTVEETPTEAEAAEELSSEKQIPAESD